MTLDILRLVIDFGLLVFIWTVQLIIYPSFGYYSKANLYTWHKHYTTRVTLIVLPLMYAQLITVVIQLWFAINWYTVLSAIIIFILWLITFIRFVPLHQRIETNSIETNTLKVLVAKNWRRTLLWSLLFMSSIIYNLL
jgi:hypothetical protein